MSLTIVGFVEFGAYSQTFTISGTYLDKKNNAISGANVQYLFLGTNLVGNTQTAANGSFSMQVVITGLDPVHKDAVDFSLSRNQPNPFSVNTFFTATIPGSGNLSIFSITGQKIVSIGLASAGTYQLKWGGLDQNRNKVPTGIYLYSLNSLGETISNKMFVIHGEGFGSALEVLSYSNGQKKLKITGKLLTNDILRFTKTNTSQIDLSFPTPSGDTVLGNVIGNVGPNNIGTLVTTVNINNLPQWNLNQYFYNDDQSIYTVNDPVNFNIISDTLLVFIGTNTGPYSPQITATDPVNNALTAFMIANITVTNQQVINITGTYLDKINNPIASADVYYYQQGNILLGQTTTGGPGDFSLSIIRTGTTLDTMKFEKPNTSLKKIGLHTPLSDTSLGVIIGNIGPTNTGTINETHYTIENTVQWNLNNYFTNDDQSNYSVSGTYYSITGTNLHFTVPSAGSYAALVTATDPQDPTLTATMNVTNTVIATMVIPDFTIAEDTALFTIIPDLNVYKNPGYTGTLTYSVISNSNTSLLQVAVNGSALNLTYLQPDGHGTSQIGIKMTNGSLADTCYFNIIAQSRCDLSGNVYDIFTNTLMVGATMQFTFPSGMVTVVTDNSGHYKVQVPKVTSKTYFALRIQKTSYTPFHTWATITSNNDTIENFKIIPSVTSAWTWNLYDSAFRSMVLYSNTIATIRWLNPPYEDIFSDNSLVGGANITVNFNNCIINLQTILPTFDSVESKPSNIIQFTSFSGYTLQDGHIAIYWNNSISGVGVIGCTYNGPIQKWCEVQFRSTVGCNTGCAFPGSNNTVFNQELGSGFGARLEPPQSPNYVSVFTDPTSANTYTPYDYSCSNVRLTRSKIHYKVLSYGTNPEGFDWEVRPDSVAMWYPTDAPKINLGGQKFWVKRIADDGSTKTEIYDYDKVPSSVMKQFHLIFRKEEIEKREKEEQQGILK